MLIDIVKKLVSIKTIVDDSTLEAVNYVKEFAESFGSEVDVIYKDYNGILDKNRACIVVTIGPKNKKGLVLSGHLDTVPAKGNWTNNPFSLTKDNGRHYGNGSCDMKSGIAIALQIMKDIDKSKLKNPIHLVLTHDEEGVFTGIRQLVKRGFDKINPNGFIGAIVLEPTELEPVIGHKGFYSAQVVVKGKSAHSAYSHLGVDAIYYAVLIYQKFSEIMKKHIKIWNVDEDYMPSSASYNIGVFNGGEAVNQVPGMAIFSYSIRYLVGNDVSSALKEFEEYCSGVKEVSIALKEQGIADAFLADMNSDFVKTVVGKKKGVKVSYGTEAGYLSSVGIPTVIFGPGSINQAHAIDEYIEEKQLLDGLEEIRDMVSRLVL